MAQGGPAGPRGLRSRAALSCQCLTAKCLLEAEQPERVLPSMFGESDGTDEEAVAPIARSRHRRCSRQADDARAHPAQRVVASSRDAYAELERAIAAQDRSIEWHDWIHKFLGTAKRASGGQLRKLIVEFMFIGMNPTTFCLARGGLDIDDRVGAERKPHARAFMRNNKLLPRQLHTEAQAMHAAALAHSRGGHHRADVFTAGFPCQPWSSQKRRRSAPEGHALFECAELSFDYILRTRPSVAILEMFAMC